MLKPNAGIKEFEKFGFKKCKGKYGKAGCYYLCVAKGCKMLLVSKIHFSINDWKNDDPRIHKKPNCKYKDCRDYLDMVYDLITLGMVIKNDA